MLEHTRLTRSASGFAIAYDTHWNRDASGMRHVRGEDPPHWNRLPRTLSD